MSVSYIKLWHILIDRGMKKKDLEEQAQVSHYMMKKLARNEVVPADVLGKISKALDCTIDDIIDFTEDPE